MTIKYAVNRILNKEYINTSTFYSHVLPYRIIKAIYPSHKIDTVRIYDGKHSLQLDPTDALNLAWYRIYEPFETQTMLNSIDEGDTVLDLGAFIGYYSVQFSYKVGPKGSVYSVEASPNNFDILKENTRKYDNIHIENRAVAKEHNSTVSIYECNSNNGMNRIYPSKYSSSKTSNQKVKTMRLDSYFAGRQPINFIKMDLEGSEFGALEGMEEIFQNNKGVKLMMEFHPDSIKEYGKNPRDLIELLYSYGLKPYHLNKKTKQKELIKLTITSTGSNIDDFVEYSNNETTNLICE
ncbi:hypothetical protein NMY3_01491 [Candidatus Nitrosocosmicus oleophilus]|uniref:Methyltransferase FkbM domain-containing protein n=1 Tax=Candidatus Nitrosocosmicus oleophilus TaxID=1353260 RepID=A0A654LW57_9ARCH|nr:FkbM family methyltransferase [Candidatus Nitrosocosmicus oleophilus]ALI35694.1 hypothetical protein NMY3_01491 [Candidatus Nitrosocosmicus oleophilus]